MDPQITPQGLVEVAEFDTQDGIYDCAWSEVGEALHALCLGAYAPSLPLY